MKFTLELSKFPIDSDFLKRNVQEIQNTLAQEMQNVRARIIASDTAGQQAEGGGLKPYSSSYKAAIDAGRVAGKALGNHTPNLTATGTLHRSMKIEPGDQPGEVRMFFEGTHPPARKVTNPGQRVKQANKKRGSTGLAPLAPHKHVRQAKSQGGGSGKKPTGTRHQGGGGGDTQNAVIAQAQYDMGRTGWFTFSKADLDRIQKRVGDLIMKLLVGK